jgi:transposase
MLMVGYFEGLDSERGIAWRCADSLSLRNFLGYVLTQKTPDHTTVSRTRRLLDVETHERIFSWVLRVLADHKLIDGKTIGVDATTLEANAAMRSIVRRDTGEGYQEFLTRLAKASGIETPSREDLAKLDRDREKKTSNEEWEHPEDPDARITKMKDGRTHLAHKAEHAVDLETGAVLAVTVQAANDGDTTTIKQTLIETAEQIEGLVAAPEIAAQLNSNCLAEVVADKGYHSNEILTDLADLGIRTYISEPKRGRRNWTGKTAERDAVYANRRRIRGDHGKALLRRRVIHIGAFNLSLVLRQSLGAGTPRGLQDFATLHLKAIFALSRLLLSRLKALRDPGRLSQSISPLKRRETGIIAPAPNRDFCYGLLAGSRFAAPPSPGGRGATP